MDGTQALGSQVHSQLGWRSWLFWDKLGHGYRPRSTSTKAEVGLAGQLPRKPRDRETFRWNGELTFPGWIVSRLKGLAGLIVWAGWKEGT